VTVSVELFKTPASLTTDGTEGAEGCVDRRVVSTAANPSVGRTGVGPSLGTARVSGKAPVPLVLNAANVYEAELGVLAADTEVTLVFDAAVPELGGTTVKATSKRLDMTAAGPLRFTRGQPYSVAWGQDVEGPSFWYVADGETLPGTTIAAHYVECRSSASVRATTIDGALFEGLDWSDAATSGTYVLRTNVAPKTHKTAAGATVNVYSQASYASSFRVQ